jgi:hypothetical protein
MDWVYVPGCTWRNASSSIDGYYMLPLKMAIIRIFGLSLICTFFVACWYAPYWMHGMISYLPMDGLFLYTQTEYYTMKTICWLTFITSFPYRWYLTIRYFNIRYTLVWYTYIYRLVIWFRCMCLGL